MYPIGIFPSLGQDKIYVYTRNVQYVVVVLTGVKVAPLAPTKRALDILSVANAILAGVETSTRKGSQQ